ncbi:DEAD/DEAH box helicase [Streptomonospora wellingtoniae]|uniref:DEAD/DEAH box helicase n=1 Tax=Streptomonospora wellingtoniae TaxID=3075544 RepID=A0ABU2KTK2_9ACTN|nr:DEAD/DEAH box helicase [Streptomonospora sp. DSM 45055]MDT0302614.1 DEAD/DEAH box helicase [Streptomonospora sp. DSM 45055]
MLILHGRWQAAEPGRRAGALLWAEDDAGPSPAAAGRPASAAPDHPFAASAQRLRAAVAALADGAGAADCGTGEGKLRLPASGGAPLRSRASDMQRRRALPPGAAGEDEAAEWGTWRVPRLHVPATHAPPLLAALRSAAAGGVPAADETVAAGPGFAHLAAVDAFAERLLEGGHLLPRLVGEPPRALWRPVLTRAGTEHFGALVAALPPSAADESRPGRSTVYRALADLLDARARIRLAGPAEPGGQRLSAALTGGDYRLQPDSAADRDLAARLSAWHTAAQREAAAARLVFRLVEPDPADGAGAPGREEWRVEFWVQSGADPSLQVSLSALWLGEGADRLPLGVESDMLADLDRAARFYPALREVLAEPAPAALTLDTARAHSFIRDTAPRLSSGGFAVVLPEWSGRTSLALHLTARERPGGGGIGASDLLDFSLEAVCDGERVDTAELAELARLKQPLVRLRGRWVEVDPGHLRTALAYLRRRGSGTMRREDALRLLVSPTAAPLPLAGVDADGALGELLSAETDACMAPLEPPEGFTGKLRPYQSRGAAWLRFLGELGLGAVLADDMGLGKTVQLLAVLADERRAGNAERPGPTLLVCPVSLVGNWQRESAGFAPALAVHLHHGPARLRGNALARAAGTADLVVTTYGTVLRDADELAAMPWHRVVCDEAQALKNSGTRQAAAVRRLPARTRIALTGTPVENNLDELWSVMEFANPGLLGSQQAFRDGIAARVERAAAAAGGAAEPDAGDDSAAHLRRITGPFILRRLKTDKAIISDLPEKLESRAWCTLTPEQASLYQAAVDDMTERLADAEGIRRKGVVLAAMARLKQICNHPAQFLGDGSPLAGRSGKLERLRELLEHALAAGDKALCFTQYTALGARLAPYLAERLGCEVLWLHGGTARAEREEITRRFQTSPRALVLLLSLKAAGTGLNLTAANHVLHIDRWWNPAVEDQATDRAFRIGQRRDVQVRKLVCMGTLEERIDGMIERKRRLAATAVGTGEDWLGDLSTARLREVVRLAPEAVGP